MKILRNLFILVAASFIVASCEKSNSGPGRCGEKSQNQQTETTAPADQVQPSGNTIESGRSSIILDNETQPTAENGAAISGDPDTEDVSGSGDDDRDGGEKKKRKR